MEPSPLAGRQPRIDQRVGFWLGPILFVVLLLSPPPASMREAVRERFAQPIAREAARLVPADLAADSAAYADAHAARVAELVAARSRLMMAAGAVAVLVACWWITVAVPIPVTSLLPLVLFPIVGVMPVGDAAAPYANSNIFLFMGGFIIALGVERWQLHRRIALHVVRVVGTGRATIVLGFMLASAGLSMWISNTATAMMMLPIAMAIITAVPVLGGDDNGRWHTNFAAALMLGVAYGANIGGVGTPIGTPPNIAFRGQLARLFPDAPEISFGQWMLAFVPLVLVFVPVVWLILTRVTCPVGRTRMPIGRDVIRAELRKLGSMSRPEALMLGVFVLTAVLWMTRSIPVGTENYGWSVVLEWWLATDPGRPGLFRGANINDATVALAMAALLFVIPARRGVGGRRDEQGQRNGRGPREYLMDWPTAQRLPWGILLLFGGGFAIAAGFQVSGLSYWCGKVFAEVGLTQPLFVVLGTCLIVTFLTEITSNTATAQVMLPILARVSTAIGVNPLLLMLPATISASCAFMLPVATPPNAIVFGSGYVDMGRMVRSGVVINLVGVVLVTATFYFVVRPMLGLDVHAVPGWAE